MISYNTVVGDTLSKVLVRFIPSLGTSMGTVRFFLVFLVTLVSVCWLFNQMSIDRIYSLQFVTTPLCLYKNVSRLAKISFIR
jgi:solute carrier family 38 (sodium-coupled neutral amino acid transporter), member 11